MENIIVANLHEHQRTGVTAKKKTKKKKPIKVVYISNPKKFNTSATEFRALVQELTGKDSDPSKFADPDFYDVGHHDRTEDQPPPLDNITGSKIDGDDEDDDQVFSLDLDPTTTTDSPDHPSPPPLLLAEPFDEYHDAFMPPHHHQTYENNNISRFLFSDFSHVDLLYEELMECK
ncbi:hypothetical protein HS088_TW13G00526 [Tripterygium wilfordii]|uniref:VQ domain-containing protein n=1 Tax=Tripterygium wilfordii TaxID=458696 RepID=A0A7J7CUK9_TRIWF|nr:uncharacterized protein LOC120013395 [Tripterygium wilfordii]KAF5737639.1 hypothetical protein HS088_TW13G00526 [Tripterygium wilfordii]